ncbi:hypothetical protein ACEPAF_3855 [Sanghuangporus sanghuang]
MSSSAPNTVVKSLYRSLLREANKLPYGYLRAFFRFKCRDDVDAAARAITRNRRSSSVKLKRLSQDLRRLKAANDGHKHAFMRVLNLAYGRVGKLRWELLEPFRHSKATEVPPPIIPGVEESRPPAFSKELVALLGSSISRSSDRGLHPQQLKTPPSLSTRVDPSSEEARLLGPLSKRREVNARWRFFSEELRRVKPPLQVSVSAIDVGAGVVRPFSGSDRIRKTEEFGLAEGGFQDSGLLESLESMATSDIRQWPVLRRERTALAKKDEAESTGQEETLANSPAPVFPTRFLRRTHRQLLTDVPLLTYLHKKFMRDGQPRESASYGVSLMKQANSAGLHHTSSRLPLIDEASLAWVQRAQKMDEGKKSKRKGDKL